MEISQISISSFSLSENIYGSVNHIHGGENNVESKWFRVHCCLQNTIVILSLQQKCVYVAQALLLALCMTIVIIG